MNKYNPTRNYLVTTLDVPAKLVMNYIKRKKFILSNYTLWSYKLNRWTCKRNYRPRDGQTTKSFTNFEVRTDLSAFEVSSAYDSAHIFSRLNCI